MDVLLPWLFIRKKFFNFCGRWVLGVSFVCFLDEKDRLEKFRLSLALAMNAVAN